MKSNKSFTLIELLVVVAIIGILASILLPSLARARGASQRAVCLSNMKQIGIALTMYTDDNNDHFPPQGVGSSYVNWFGKKGTVPGGSWVPSKRPLNYYILSSTTIADDEEVKVAECPSEWRSYKWFGTAYKPNIRQTINGLHISPTTSSRKVTEINSPVKFVVTTEWGAFKNVSALSLKDYNYIHDIVGKPRWNQLFGDGHVEFSTVNSGVITSDSYTFDRDQ